MSKKDWGFGKRLIVEKLVDIYEKDDVYKEQINFRDGLTVMLFVGVLWCW